MVDGSSAEHLQGLVGALSFFLGQRLDAHGYGWVSFRCSQGPEAGVCRLGEWRSQVPGPRSSALGPWMEKALLQRCGPRGGSRDQSRHGGRIRSSSGRRVIVCRGRPAWPLGWSSAPPTCWAARAFATHDAVAACCGSACGRPPGLFGRPPAEQLCQPLLAPGLGLALGLSGRLAAPPWLGLWSAEGRPAAGTHCCGGSMQTQQAEDLFPPCCFRLSL